jgi:hypothetical protein
MNAPSDTTRRVRLRDGLWLLALVAGLGAVYAWDWRQVSTRVVSGSLSNPSEPSRTTGDLLTPAADEREATPREPSPAHTLAESTPSSAEVFPGELEKPPLPDAQATERTSEPGVPAAPSARIVPAATPPAQIVAQPQPTAQIAPPSKPKVVRTVEVIPEETPPAEKSEPVRLEVEFFQTTAEAQSVTYVVDCSGSMAGRRFERAQAELNRSVSRLKPGQRFHVSFFHSGARPMFEENPPAGLAAASPAMTTRLQEWMAQIRAGGGTRPDAALQIAARLKPDVIYLLSDGEFSPLSATTKELIQTHQIVVHTIAFESSAGARLLEDIANGSGGTYRFIPAQGAGLKFEFANRLSGDGEARLQSIIAGAADAWELAHGMGQPAPSLLEEMFELLRDPDPRLRQDIQKGLSFLTGDVEFALPDHADAAAREAVVQQWQAWYSEETRQGYEHRLRATARREQPARLKAMVESPNVHERRAVAGNLSTRSQRMVNHLLTLVADQDAQVRAAARHGLVAMADGQDFGPPDDATDEQRAAAVAGWQGWWEECKLQEKLRLARMMTDVNPAAAARRLEEIIRERPDAETGKEARALLDQISKLSVGAAPDPASPPDSGIKPPRRPVSVGAAAAESGADSAPVRPSAEDERVAEKTFDLAIQFLARDPAALQARLREIIQRHPGTRAAQRAEKHLEQLSRQKPAAAGKPAVGTP